MKEVYLLHLFYNGAFPRFSSSWEKIKTKVIRQWLRNLGLGFYVHPYNQELNEQLWSRYRFNKSKFLFVFLKKMFLTLPSTGSPDILAFISTTIIYFARLTESITYLRPINYAFL